VTRQLQSGWKMTNAIDRLRAKFRFVLLQIEKARGREMVARRKTNKALDRTKAAEKKTFYLRHRLGALTDKLFIYSMTVERTMMNLAISKKNFLGNQNKTVRDNQQCERKFEQDISNLEALEREYNGDIAVLDATRDTMGKRLEDLEKRISSANERVKILENKLLKSSETLRLRKMKRDLENQRRTSRAQVLIHLRRYLELAKARSSRAEDKIRRLSMVKRQIAENLEAQTNVILQAKKEAQRMILTKRKSSTC
jgi:hypothetical protein